MDMHFVDDNGNHFVVPDAPEGYEREDATQIAAPPSPEHRWVGGEWVILGRPEPTLADLPLKKWQFFAMVDYLGVGDAIETAIGSIEDPMQRAVVRSRYLNSDVYNRDDPLFDQIAAQIGLALEDLDAAWLTIAAPE